MSARAACRYKVVLVLLVACAATRAGTVDKVEVSHRRGVYQIHATATLQAPLETVRGVATDHDGLYRLSRVLTASRLLERYSPTRVKRRLDIHTCVLLFCVDFAMTENVEVLDDGTITTSIIPEESDFSSGASRWQLTAIDAAHTRVELSAHRAPRFWVPPLIGPLILKQKMRREMIESMLRIEELANDTATPPP